MLGSGKRHPLGLAAYVLQLDIDRGCRANSDALEFHAGGNAAEEAHVVAKDMEKLWSTGSLVLTCLPRYWAIKQLKTASKSCL